MHFLAFFWLFLAAWRPSKKLKSRPAYDIIIPDAAFDGIPFDDDEELTPGADEDIQSPLPLQDPVAFSDDGASYICQIAGYEDIGRRRTSQSMSRFVIYRVTQKSKPLSGNHH